MRLSLEKSKLQKDMASFRLLGSLTALLASAYLCWVTGKAPVKMICGAAIGLTALNAGQEFQLRQDFASLVGKGEQQEKMLVALQESLKGQWAEIQGLRKEMDRRLRVEFGGSDSD